MRPAPAPALPRPASTVLALRPSSPSFEVLLVRRARSAEFMGDAMVFPGGSVDAADHGPVALRAVRWDGDPAETAWRAAALRELAEEAGVAVTDPEGLDVSAGDPFGSVLAAGGRLDAERLAYLSNWVTPDVLPKRFDTRFYVAVVDEGTAASADRNEVFEPSWVTPAEAMSRADLGHWLVEFPTRRHLELLDRFDDAEAVFAFAEGQERVPRVEPKIEFDNDGSIRVIVPGEEVVGR